MAKIILFIAKEQKPHHCVVSSRVARNTYDEIFHECSAAVAGIVDGKLYRFRSDGEC